MKCRKDIEGEDSLWPVKCGRKPSCTKDLCSPMEKTVLPTVAKVDCKRMEAGNIDHAEVERSGKGAPAGRSSVSELNSKPEIFECRFCKARTSPQLPVFLVDSETYA